MYGVLVTTLEDEIRLLEKTSLENPPPDYSGVMKLVGRRQGLLQALQIVRELYKENDELS